MASEGNRERAGQLAERALERGEPLGWFDGFYESAAGDTKRIPWAERRPNVNLVSWLSGRSLGRTAKSALVVGCGLGDDAELIASEGPATTAFDLAPRAVEWCRSRHPDSAVTYVVADLLDTPAPWKQAFDFVFEAYTLQVLPPAMRPAAVNAIAECVAPGGRLLVISRGRGSDDEVDGFPWPLARAEVESFVAAGLSLEKFEDYHDDESPPVRRFRAVFCSERC